MIYDMCVYIYIFIKVYHGLLYYTALYATYFFKTRKGQFFKKMIEESVCSITKIIGNHNSKRNICFFYLFFINKIIKPDKYLQKTLFHFLNTVIIFLSVFF